MRELHRNTLTELAAALKSRRVSSVELTRELLERIGHIERSDKALNAFISVTRESALAAAETADRALGAGERVAADGPLTEALARQEGVARAGTVLSVDLFYERSEAPAGSDALAVEMEAATLFALGAAAAVPIACILAVSDTFDGEGRRTRIDDQALQTAAARMGTIACAALGDGGA